MRFLVTGATGYTGRQVVMNLSAQGHAVRALVRDRATFDWLEFGPKVEPWMGDALQPETLRGIDQDVETVINTIGGGLAGGEKGLDRIMVQTVQNLVGAVRQRRLKRFVHVSHVAVYSGGEVSEATPPAPHGPVGRAALRAEEWLRGRMASSGLPLVLVRAGMIYGPFRTFAAPLRAGKLRLIGGGQNRQARIHVDDLAAILTAAALKGDPGAIYNAVDDDPAPARDFFALVAEQAGVKPPRGLGVGTARFLTATSAVVGKVTGNPALLGPAAIELATLDLVADNQKIKRDLGVQLSYPSFRLGVPAALAVESGVTPQVTTGS